MVHLESVEPNRVGSRSEVIESDWIIPSLDVGDEKLTLNVTTNSTLSTNMIYNVTLITAMEMIEAGNVQFCKCTVSRLQIPDLSSYTVGKLDFCG